MNASWFHRTAQAVACAGALTLLAACGSGSVVSDLNPQRFLTVGDGFMDVGQTGHVFTVNDGSTNWVQDLAAHYNSLTVTPANSGGWGFAQGNARVAAADTTSGSNAPSVQAQIDILLGRTALVDGDVVVVGGGIADIVTAVNATGISTASTQAVQAAGQALAGQVQRLVNAGAKHVLVVGVYNLGNTPWAVGLGQQGAITDLSVAFNDTLLVGIKDLSKNVLFVDPALLYNLIYNKPQNYALDNHTQPACTTPDASTCTPGTIVAGADYTQYMFADSLYLTPKVSRYFGSNDYAQGIYYQFKRRW